MAENAAPDAVPADNYKKGGTIMIIQKKVKIFTVEQQFPCGQNATCCGPVGQSEQQIAEIKSAITKLGLDVELFDLKKMSNLNENLQVAKLFSTFGAQVTPLITVGDEVISIGQSEIKDVISAVKSKL